MQGWITGERNDSRCSFRLQSGGPCPNHFLRVSGADIQQVWHCAIQAVQLNWLVCWPVLALADGVVCGDVYYPEVAQGTHAHCRACVQVKHEECRGDREEAALLIRCN